MDELQTSAQDAGAHGQHQVDPDTEALRREWSEWRKGVDLRFALGDRQFGRLRKEMRFNTEITSEIRDVVMAFAAFARFCKRVGRGVAWCTTWTFRVVKVGGAIAASIAAIWGVVWAVKHGMPPPTVEEALPGHELPARPGERSVPQRK